MKQRDPKATIQLFKLSRFWSAKSIFGKIYTIFPKHKTKFLGPTLEVIREVILNLKVRG